MRKIPPFRFLDVFRGLAALWVVMAHACAPKMGDHPELLSNPIYAISIWGQVGVVLFFVISGYCIVGAAYSALNSGKTIGRYFIDRLRRIYPPYLATIIIAVFLDLMVNFAISRHLIPSRNHVGGPRDGLFWFANLTLLQVPLHQEKLVVVFWTLCYEVAFYGIVGIALAFAQTAARKSTPEKAVFVLFSVLNIVTLASLLLVTFVPKYCPFPIELWYQFGFGILLFQMVAKIPVPQRLKFFDLPIVVSATVAAAVLFAIVRSTWDGLNGHPSTRVQVLVTLGFTILLWFLQPKDEKLSEHPIIRPIIKLGIMSYSLYLIHSLLEGFVDVILRRMHIDGNLYWINYLAQILVSLIAGYIFFIVVERRFISVAKRQEIKQVLSEVPA